MVENGDYVAGRRGLRRGRWCREGGFRRIQPCRGGSLVEGSYMMIMYVEAINILHPAEMYIEGRRWNRSSRIMFIHTRKRRGDR